MNDCEFTALVAPHLPMSRITVTPAQKASGLRQKAVSWRNQLGEFKKYFAKHTPEERPKELEAELRALKKAVDELLAAGELVGGRVGDAFANQFANRATSAS